MRHRLLLLVPLLALAAGLVFATGPSTPAGSAAEPAFTFVRDLVYGQGDGQDLTLNLARPTRAKGKLPAVLVFHGGGWTKGKKERHDALVRFLAKEGFVAATVQYRLAPRNPWPAQVEDAKCAVRWLRAQAETYQVDPHRIAALGFSAGAHLSMLLGTMDPDDGLHGEGGHAGHSSKVNAVVSFFGPTDLGCITEGARAEALTPARLRREVSGRILGALLGSDFCKDPSRASPLSYITQGDAPMLLVQGTQDRLVPYEQAKRMLDGMHEAGVPGEVVFWLGLGHGWDDPQLTDSMDHALRFLDRQFRPGRRQSLRSALLKR